MTISYQAIKRSFAKSTHFLKWATPIKYITEENFFSSSLSNESYQFNLFSPLFISLSLSLLWFFFLWITVNLIKEFNEFMSLPQQFVL